MNKTNLVARNGRHALSAGALAFLFSLLTATQAFATNQRMITGDASFLSTNAGYRSNEFNLGYQQPFERATAPSDIEQPVDLFGLDLSYTEGSVDELHFVYQKVTPRMEFVFGKTRLQLSVGFVNREDSGLENGSAQAFTTRVGVVHDFGKVTATVDAGHGVYGDVLQSRSSTQNLAQGPFWGANILYKPAKRWHLNYTHRSAYLNDSNTRSDDDASVMYGLSPDWPWIWIGAGYYRLTDSNTTNGYWAPRVFSSYGPRVDISVPLFGAFSASLGLNYNWYNDIDFGSGIGYYGVAKITHGSYGSRQISLGVESIDSKQEASRWTSTAILASVIWPF